MNLERFKNSPSGRLLKVGQGDVAYRAFVPNALPPSLNLDAELIRILSGADRALGELAGLGRTMPNPDLLIRPFIRQRRMPLLQHDAEIASSSAEGGLLAMTRGAVHEPPLPYFLSIRGGRIKTAKLRLPDLAGKCTMIT